MKLQTKQIHLFTNIGSIILAVMLLFAGSSCAKTTSNIGKTVPNNQALSITSDSTKERIWQTKDATVTFQTVKSGSTHSVEGSLHVNDSITNTFPYVKWLRFCIYYLDENNKVISSNEVNINTGYRNKIAKNLKLINVPDAPQDAVSFAFGYWGVMISAGNEDGHDGEWEIYFDPFKVQNSEEKSTGNGLFYAD